MLVEDDRAHVGLVDDRVDQHELRVGEFRRDDLHGGGVRKARDDDRVVPALREAAQRLLALGVLLEFELGVFDARLLLEPLGALVGGLVEGFVELAAPVEDDRRVGVLGMGRDRREREGGGRSHGLEKCHPGSSEGRCRHDPAAGVRAGGAFRMRQ